MSRIMAVICGIGLFFFMTPVVHAAEIDRTKFDSDGSVKMTATDNRIVLTWPTDDNDAAITLDLDPDHPLFTNMSVNGRSILGAVDPVYVVTVGKRNLSTPAGWTIFFDNPRQRPFQRHTATLERTRVAAVSNGPRTTVSVGPMHAGPFEGELRLTIFPHSRLVQMTAALTTQQDGCAILYDIGIVSDKPATQSVSWIDTQDRLRSIPTTTPTHAEPIAVRSRTIVAQNDSGSVAIFAPPHQYFYPLDFAVNLGWAWQGTGWPGLGDKWGFGLRQPLDGDNRWVPWINAPPANRQQLSAFLLLSPTDAAATYERVRTYTHNDSFKRLDGYKTFTSHYHIEHTFDLLARQQKLKTDRLPIDLVEPGFVKAFKSMGVNMVHLAEFHDGKPPELKDVSRVDLLKKLHEECARLSTDNFLLLPGEEPNVHLGGHWISLFPKPVLWTPDRTKNQPFVEQTNDGSVYHVGNADDVLRLMEAEHGLMWTAHARIKASFGFPDAYRSTTYFQSDHFLGAAWKAMPADLSKDRLGTRILDLLSDMDNWGPKKLAIGEVDVFRVNPDYELYGNMNINYVRLDALPKFSDGWQPLLDALRAGRFFVTTGEVLLPQVSLDQKRLVADIEWTFPLAFAEIVSGDGENVFRTRIDLAETNAFGSKHLDVPVDLTGRKWARLEVWDVACNGAFTQPIWFSR